MKPYVHIPMEFMTCVEFEVVNKIELFYYVMFNFQLRTTILRSTEIFVIGCEEPCDVKTQNQIRCKADYRSISHCFFLCCVDIFELRIIFYKSFYE